MKNKISEGMTVNYSNSGAKILSGVPVVLVDRIGIAIKDIAAATGTGPLALTGVYSLTKKAAITPAQGSRLYWDAGNAEITSSRGDGVFAGWCFQSPAGADAEVKVTLGDPGDVPTTAGTGTIDLPVGAWMLENGTALTLFVDAAADLPGRSQEADKEMCLRWNNHAAPVAVIYGTALPKDIDPAEDMTLHMLANVDGATDTPVIAVELYFGVGDTDVVTVHPEITGGTTLTLYTANIPAADIPVYPSNLTVSLGPLAGELGTDDARVFAVWLTYKKL